MKKEIKDFLCLYLGCKAMYGGYGDPERVVKIIGVSLGYGVNFCFQDNGKSDMGKAYEYFKPILRKLCDMTQDEAKSLNLVDIQIGLLAFHDLPMYLTAAQFYECLKLHFDLFGLIESGLAIDATTLNKEAK